MFLLLCKWSGSGFDDVDEYLALFVVEDVLGGQAIVGHFFGVHLLYSADDLEEVVFAEILLEWAELFD